MNRIKKLFADKKENVLSVYFTAGFPQLHDTQSIITSLEKAGADILEIGIPFSDPLADGPVIQESSAKALSNGMSIDLLFEQLKEIRKSVKLPLILMTYLNPVLQYGISGFCKKAAECGIDGLIIPDLPMQEYEQEYKKLFRSNGLLNVLFITPHTTEERIRKIDSVSEGFIYMVATAGVTGARDNVSHNQEEYFKYVKSLQLKNPVLAGFGISNHETFMKACTYVSGAIIGSAFIKTLSESGAGEKTISAFIDSIVAPSNQKVKA